jgi:TRAP-type C4-dicarboxylate transport system permease small subunit
MRLHQTGRTTSILRIPYSLIYSAVPIGGLLMLRSFITTEGRELFPSERAETGGQTS